MHRMEIIKYNNIQVCTHAVTYVILPYCNTRVVGKRQQFRPDCSDIVGGGAIDLRYSGGTVEVRRGARTVVH